MRAIESSNNNHSLLQVPCYNAKKKQQTSNNQENFEGRATNAFKSMYIRLKEGKCATYLDRKLLYTRAFLEIIKRNA